MAEQRIQAPYGDIFFANTPAIDALGKQLYAEQRMREVKQQQENAALDGAIRKEIGKVRSVDTPEVIKAYQDYKTLRQQLLFNKDLRKDPLAYNQAQQAANQRYQNIFSVANKSAEVKKMQEQLATDRMKNADAYSDDAGERIGTLMQTPISALGQHPQFGDLTNWDNYRYQGSNTDFAKMLRDATGQPKQVYSAETPMDGGLQVKITPYNFGNTPGQVKDYLLGSFATHSAGRDAAYQWDHLPEEEIANTIKQYQAIPKERWQRMGLSAPQDLLSKNPANKAENFAAYQAMKYAISNEPKEGTPVFRQNVKAVKDLDFARQKQMEALRHSNAAALIRLRKQIDPNDTELNNEWVEAYLQEGINNAKSDKNNLRDIYTPNTNQRAHELKGDIVLTKALTRGKSEPDKIYVTEDGKIWPIFFKYRQNDKKETVVVKDAKGNPVIDEDYSQPMTMDQAKLALGYKGQTKKQLSSTMSGNKTGTASKKYSVNGTQYSHKQLNDMGYDDNEIDQAIKSGLIK